jgi:hypothetical protein
VDFLSETRIVTPFNEPAGTRVIRSGFHVDLWVVVLDPNFDCLQLLTPVLGNHDRDALQVACQHRQGPGSFRRMLALEHLWIDMDLPAFDLPDDRIEVFFRGSLARSLGFRICREKRVLWRQLLYILRSNCLSTGEHKKVHAQRGKANPSHMRIGYEKH